MNSHKNLCESCTFNKGFGLHIAPQNQTKGECTCAYVGKIGFPMRLHSSICPIHTPSKETKGEHFVCECSGIDHWCTSNCPGNKHTPSKPVEESKMGRVDEILNLFETSGFTKTKHSLLAEIEKVIGENEPSEYFSEKGFNRHRLREEQREKLRKLFE